MITPEITEIAKRHDPNCWIGKEAIFFQTSEQAENAWKEIKPLARPRDFQSLSEIYIFDNFIFGGN